jgi:hypothetical protein
VGYSLSGKELSDLVCAGNAAMSQEAKDARTRHWHEAMDRRSVEAKSKTNKMISESVRESNVVRNNLIAAPNVSEDFARWFTGFFEGDGSPYFTEPVNNNGTGVVFKPEIGFAQKDADVVEYVAQVLQGNLSWVKRKQGLYRQVRWAAQLECIPILRLISEYIVSQLRCEQLNVLLERLGLPLCCVHKPTMIWVVGFWDAEGSIEDPKHVIGSTVLSFSQKESAVLYSVRDFLGVGRVHFPPAGPRLTIRHRDGSQLAEAILKYGCIGRKQQMLKERWFGQS